MTLPDLNYLQNLGAGGLVIVGLYIVYLSIKQFFPKGIDTKKAIVTELKLANENHLNHIQKSNSDIITVIKDQTIKQGDANFKMIEILGRIEGKISN